MNWRPGSTGSRRASEAFRPAPMLRRGRGFCAIEPVRALFDVSDILWRRDIEAAAGRRHTGRKRGDGATADLKAKIGMPFADAPQGRVHECRQCGPQLRCRQGCAAAARIRPGCRNVPIGVCDRVLKPVAN